MKTQKLPNLTLIKDPRPLDTYGRDVDIFTKGLRRASKASLGRLPKKVEPRLKLIMGGKK